MVPTSKLPQIRTIPSQSTQNLAEALQYLRSLYQPPVRGSRRRRSSRFLSLTKDTRVPRDVHLDPFERNYTIRWLTALISYLETQDNSADIEPLIQLAASILALCSGTSAAGTFHRDLVFTSNSISPCSITLRVKDIPLNNQDYASVGAQTWGGACVLSESIVDEPWKFCLCHAPQNDFPMKQNSASYFSPLCRTKHRPRPLRILELGAGTGLVSLTICKLLQNLVTSHGLPSLVSSETPSPSVAALDSSLRPTSKPIPIASAAVLIATDHYLPVLENLASNIATNFPSHTQQSNDPISFTSHHLDWSHFSSTYATGNSTAATPPKPFDEPFDVIFGADIIYELDHASWIKSCLSVLLRKPDYFAPSDDEIDTNANSLDPAFHLVIPLRSTHAKESRTVELVFPFSEYCRQGVRGVSGARDEAPPSTVRGFGEDACGTLEMCVLSKEVIICEAEDGEGDDDGEDGEDVVTYLYYKIGWSVPCHVSVSV